jgi:hypothetical protein
MPSDLNKEIDAWWTAFAARSGDLRDLFKRRKEWDLPAWMHEHLGAICQKLMWEFGPAVHREGHRLVITAEWRRYLRPLVKNILNRAPQIDGWEFYPYRLPEDFEMAEQTVAARTGGSVAKTFFRATVNDVHKINLLFLARNYAPSEDKQAFNDVFVATETLLGEEILDHWIGAIEVAPLDNGPEEPQGIRDLKCVVDGLIESVKSHLPEVPYYRLPNDTRWSVFELTPKEAEDYPHQRDMFVGTTMIKPMWRNAHSNHSFDSERFSRHGEVFCYLKIDGSNGLEGSKFADKGEIIDAVDPALRREEVGCYVGGGTGLRYSYLDLALTDVGRAVDVIKCVLREGSISKRTWIQFFDTDLQAEWIGIWDGAPPPPMPDLPE